MKPSRATANEPAVPKYRYSRTLRRPPGFRVRCGRGSTSLLQGYSARTIAAAGAVRDSPTRANARLRARQMNNAFKLWVGQSVVLQVVLGDLKVPLRGKLTKDAPETVRMSVGEGWEIDIYKAMIVTVEADAMAFIPAFGVMA
jgi:hypothetical protein